jgi:DNA-binding NarL/FixJ family response regulator
MTTPIIRIMLVDDHPLVRDGLRARLEAMAHLRVVAEAGNADDALAEAGLAPVDLVLMDINMRGTNGIEATARFRTQYPGIAVLIRRCTTGNMSARPCRPARAATCSRTRPARTSCWRSTP